MRSPTITARNISSCFSSAPAAGARNASSAGANSASGSGTQAHALHQGADRSDLREATVVAQLTIKTAVWLACMALLLFGSAGTWRWPAGWIYLAELGVIGMAIGVWLARHDPGLLAERM